MYWLFILFYVLAVIGVNYFISIPIFNFSLGYVSFAVVISTVAVIAIDGLTAFIVRWIFPDEWFSSQKTIFSGKQKECKFYEKIGIKKWKDKIPELGKTTGFRKNKISDPTNNQFVERYIMEANFGVAVHFAGIVCGFAIIFIYPLKYCLCFGLPIALFNAFYNSLSLFILRYNLPKLHRLHKINERRQKRCSELAVEEN